MRERDVMVAQRRPLSHSNGYVPFVMLSGPRTGSHMLAQALNSSPRITCFREVFNGRLDFVQFGVEGYDDFGSQDIALRKEEPIRFLHERILCQHAEEIQAVGFKFHYGQHWDFPGILEELVKHEEIRVLHLGRRNALRMLVSLKFAERTGVWLQEGTLNVRQSNVLKALRHPLKAARRVSRLLQRMRPLKAAGKAARVRVTIAPEELFNFIVLTNQRAARFDDLFRQHRKLTVFYEHMVDHREDAFRQVQSFLGVEPGPLAVTLRKQNPEPLGELLENYDELYEAFKDTPQASFFD